MCRLHINFAVPRVLSVSALTLNIPRVHCDTLLNGQDGCRYRLQLDDGFRFCDMIDLMGRYCRMFKLRNVH